MAAIPTPEAGLVIGYAYLWRREHEAGQDEGLKDRPSVIVLATGLDADGEAIVTVLPITHSPPAQPSDAVEIPAPIKRHLGLDAERSWVVVSEGNEFVWPGYDLRKIARQNRYDYGFLPPRFFNQVLAAFLRLHPSGRALVPRDRQPSAPTITDEPAAPSEIAPDLQVELPRRLQQLRALGVDRHAAEF
jgi:hypothetical protein